MHALRQAVRDRPEAVIGWTPDDQAILLLPWLAEPGLLSVGRAQALRHTEARKLAAGLWLVPRNLLERESSSPAAYDPEAAREAAMQRMGL